MIAGTYSISSGQAEVLADGKTIIFRNVQFTPTDQNELVTLEKIWKQNAPFTYEYFLSELNRAQVISDDKIWTLYQTRGNHKTCSVYVRAIYETLLYYNCIDQLSFPQVRTVFNNTFSTQINCSKVIENKDKCVPEVEYFNSMFSAFQNPARTLE